MGEALISYITSLKEYAAVFAYFNTSVGINPVIQKIPVGIQNKWRDRAISYKKQSNTVFPHDVPLKVLN
jgi:hypothetical protein